MSETKTDRYRQTGRQRGIKSQRNRNAEIETKTDREREADTDTQSY